MKKLGFLIFFSALFAVGMSAQTPQAPKHKGGTPKPVATATQSKPVNADTATPAKNTVSAKKSNKRRQFKAVPSAQPAPSVSQKQKMQ